MAGSPAQVFGAALDAMLPALQEELGVVRFVSKWDETALKSIPAARHVDVTDRLARELRPKPTD